MPRLVVHDCHIQRFLVASGVNAVNAPRKLHDRAIGKRKFDCRQPVLGQPKAQFQCDGTKLAAFGVFAHDASGALHNLLQPRG